MLYYRTKNSFYHAYIKRIKSILNYLDRFSISNESYLTIKYMSLRGMDFLLVYDLLTVTVTHVLFFRHDNIHTQNGNYSKNFRMTKNKK